MKCILKNYKLKYANNLTNSLPIKQSETYKQIKQNERDNNSGLINSPLKYECVKYMRNMEKENNDFVKQNPKLYNFLNVTMKIFFIGWFFSLFC